PGPALARAALASGTRGVRPLEPGRHGTKPARNTADAVAGGVALAALGFVERAYRIGARELGAEPALLVTGGDAELLAAAFPAAQRIDDLVLRGLAAWADA
ncbi:MAG: type III pantothenate kinase, partial [Xanthomonadaceae bacterium]|nr:type III pantothenate kinase [Xanthomonadaceae bacterium]